MIDDLPVREWLRDRGAAIAVEVDRLWPEEDDVAYRAAALAEEVGEVNRAVTKRRHAMHAANGLCKGLTVDQWSAEVEVELSQALGVILDIAYREGVDLVSGLTRCVLALENRERGA